MPNRPRVAVIVLLSGGSVRRIRKCFTECHVETSFIFLRNPIRFVSLYIKYLQITFRITRPESLLVTETKRGPPPFIVPREIRFGSAASSLHREKPGLKKYWKFTPREFFPRKRLFRHLRKINDFCWSIQTSVDRRLHSYVTAIYYLT